MKKTILWGVLFLFAIASFSAIKFSPQTIYIGEEVTFSIDNSNNCNSCSWDFGDGTAKILNVSDKLSVKHTYYKTGNFLITFTFGGCPGGNTPPPSMMLQITVLDNRTISISPQNPVEHEEVTISLNNAHTSLIKWDFGDGSPTLSGGISVKHTYNTTGVYTIKALEKGFLNAPVSRTIAIAPDPRTVSFTPTNPKEGDEITFSAENFKSNSLKWDFGDGTVLSGGKTIIHKYKSSGNYKIKVFDNNGKDEYPVFLSLNILKDMRKISWDPNTPVEGEFIKFIAKGFNSSSILWDYGDGNKERGSSSSFHFYKKSGSYEVKAYDFGGKDNNPVKIKIFVMRDKRRVVWKPQQPVEMEQVSFSLINFNSKSYIWRFGDRIEKRTNVPYVTHSYRVPGTFTIRVYDGERKFGIPLVAKILIQKDRRSLTISKRTVHVGEFLEVKTTGFKSNSLLWDFGDGIKKIGKQAENHVYKKVGTYTISVKDEGGKDLKIFKTQVQVLPDQRTIELSSNKIGIGEKLTLKAVNFYSKNIFWDFGDGIKKIGKPYESHFYRKKGKYTIKAIDYAGKDTKTFTKSVEVIVKKSHASSLEISRAELFFLKTMKNYAIVSKEEKMFGAKVKIKFEGTGILTAYWKIDDKPFKLINTPLSFGQYKVFTLKNIPVHGFGLHKLSFTIKSPSTKVNLLGYFFVSPSRKKIQIILPEDNSIVKKKDVSLKWEKVKKASYYRITIAQTVLSLFKKPEKKSLEKKNSYIANLKKSKESEQRYFWFVEALDKDKNIIACSDINSFLLK